MSITPFKPTGIGANAAMNVFKVTFSEALSTNPKLMAWDDYTCTTVDNTIIAGTSGSSNKSMIGGIGCTVAPSAGWFPTNETAGSAVNTSSLLNGNTGFCLLSSSAPTAGQAVYFNVNYKLYSDLVPSDTMSSVLAVQFQYTGATPIEGWYANSGTEGTPVWTELKADVEGSAPISGNTQIRACDTGEGYGGTETYKATIPSSGSSFTEEIWLRDTP